MYGNFIEVLSLLRATDDALLSRKIDVGNALHFGNLFFDG